ncbi:hypothetical protein ACFC1T_09125 [Kitasatospora sp. NPDC056076]|uniref:hypothetical protein n=1 Tax=Kitasatospora sp. NPDC056076 TaxID=3345703 RepID=UPI0035DA4DE4
MTEKRKHKMYPELATGLVEPGDDTMMCTVCGRQALMYSLDTEQHQWFSCPEHTGAVLLRLIRTGFGVDPR